MDGFTGFKTAAAEELPDAVTVMDPFHVVRLAGDALDRCRRRVQQAIHGHRGHKSDPLYSARRTLHTGADLLTDKQKDRLAALFATDQHVEVEATWGIYQRMIAAYREPDRAKGRELMTKLIESISHGVPKVLRHGQSGRDAEQLGAVDVKQPYGLGGTGRGVEPVPPAEHLALKAEVIREVERPPRPARVEQQRPAALPELKPGVDLAASSVPVLALQ
jgi:hypothetical protein